MLATTGALATQLLNTQNAVEKRRLEGETEPSPARQRSRNNTEKEDANMDSTEDLDLGGLEVKVSSLLLHTTALNRHKMSLFDIHHNNDTNWTLTTTPRTTEHTDMTNQSPHSTIQKTTRNDTTQTPTTNRHMLCRHGHSSSCTYPNMINATNRRLKAPKEDPSSSQDTHLHDHSADAHHPKETNKDAQVHNDTTDSQHHNEEAQNTNAKESQNDTVPNNDNKPDAKNPKLTIKQRTPTITKKTHRTQTTKEQGTPKSQTETSPNVQVHDMNIRENTNTKEDSEPTP